MGFRNLGNGINKMDLDQHPWASYPTTGQLGGWQLKKKKKKKASNQKTTEGRKTQLTKRFSVEVMTG